MDNNYDRAKDNWCKRVAIDAIEQLMRDLFIEFWIEFINETKEKTIEPGMTIDFKGRKIHLNEDQALGLKLMITRTYQEHH